MPHLMLSWQYALLIAGGLVSVTAVSRVPRVARTWTGLSPWGGVALEAALLFRVYRPWQFARAFTVMNPDAALPPARLLLHPEQPPPPAHLAHAPPPVL